MPSGSQCQIHILGVFKKAITELLILKMKMVNLYQQKHKDLGSQNFDQIKDFFISSIAWV